MSITEQAPSARFPKVGDEALAAVQRAVREALAEHGKAGRAVPIWRDEKIVWMIPDENGDFPDAE